MSTPTPEKWEAHEDGYIFRSRTDCVGRAYGKGATIEEQKANTKSIAQFIAAAPELAAVCRRLAGFHGERVFMQGHQGLYELQEIERAARAALAKAEGKQP